VLPTTITLSAIASGPLRVDPAFDALRDNPRFVAVVNRIGAKAE
jgi:hypothetical protein